MTSILDAVHAQLGPDSIATISQTIGADPSTTSKALSLALPAMVSGLAQNASHPHGAAALDNALQQHDGSILDNLGGLLGGGTASAIGAAILGHIFGPNRGPVEDGVGKASGLDAAQVAKLMTILAPIVMGVLGRMKREKGADASTLPDILGSGQAGGGVDLDNLICMGGSVLGGLFGKKE